MKNFIVSIGREYGCGAFEISTKLAEKLGVLYYDKEIIKRSAKESGYDENLFAFYDEKPTRSLLYNISADGFSGITNAGITLEDQIFQFQFDTIRKIADEGSCIIVGRCADYILRDNPGLLTVFLHGDIEYRRKRAVEKYGINEKTSLKEVKAMDKKRARFHDFYADERWGDARTYDLAIDVSRLGIDQTVEIIAHYIQTKFA